MPDSIRHYFSYDGEIELPEEGVADFHGKSHYFWLRQCHVEPRTGLFDLVPVNSEVLGWVREVETIWHDWDVAYHSGKVELTTHPMHAGSNPRYLELVTQIEQRVQALRETSTAAIGVVRTSPAYIEHMRTFVDRKWPVPGMYSPVLEVTWQESP